MHCRQYNDAIQELADGTLGPVRRAELQTHLDQCDGCRALAADLQKIRAAASSLEPIAPPPRVWASIANELRKEGRAVPRRALSPAMLAIAATLVLVFGGSLYVLRSARDVRPSQQTTSGAPAPGAAGGNAAAGDPVQSINEDLTAAVQHYESAIAKLEQAVKSDDGSIDPQTAAVLTRNLPVIDQAIAETKSALKSEPENAPARESLFEALRKKVGLLQDTIALMNEMRKGNSAGAAQLVDDKSKS